MKNLFEHMVVVSSFVHSFLAVDIINLSFYPFFKTLGIVLAGLIFRSMSNFTEYLSCGSQLLSLRWPFCPSSLSRSILAFIFVFLTSVSQKDLLSLSTFWYRMLSVGYLTFFVWWVLMTTSASFGDLFLMFCPWYQSPFSL